ncbi:hypothetical protein BDV3_006285 [Batrachochytrium dendrobatidis]|uniref:Mitochondrial zinc maintenance protein 1, mitochondrial n=1 Tax=Batrachochytrium dendrobatidis (strain JEL423) TaxID=403673 RepID=A0A177WP81_BATDL|nr:hypothetical protein O5D80_003012 [Batrachochytrium dendrobatidis]KAK5669006.1 hypothetical protein QVD99_004774 [Batrachochytrium dendrobatidis]OAJ41928.1 hypothetical protein BDEG_25457 [Batrachochytrium dendrobatidis JEL423]
MSVRHRDVIASYRALLRAERKTFSGDNKRIIDAAKATRLEYFKNKDEQDPAKIDQLIQIAQQARTIISRNIVQGVQAKSNSDLYSLRITDETEINSNDTIKQASKNGTKHKCCQSDELVFDKK